MQQLYCITLKLIKTKFQNIGFHYLYDLPEGLAALPAKLGWVGFPSRAGLEPPFEEPVIAGNLASWKPKCVLVEQ